MRVAEIEDNVPRFDLVHVPYAGNPNLSAQAGVFTLDRKGRVRESLHRTLPRALRSAMRRREDDDTPGAPVPAHLVREPIFYKLTLPVSQAPRLLGLLALEGVNAASVFPGYAGVARSLREKALWFPLFGVR